MPEIIDKKFRRHTCENLQHGGMRGFLSVYGIQLSLWQIRAKPGYFSLPLKVIMFKWRLFWLLWDTWELIIRSNLTVNRGPQLSIVPITLFLFTSPERPLGPLGEHFPCLHLQSPRQYIHPFPLLLGHSQQDGAICRPQLTVTMFVLKRFGRFKLNAC